MRIKSKIMHYKISELLIVPKSIKGSKNSIFIANPDLKKEILAGKLFVISEIKSSVGEKIVTFLEKEINNCYYQNEKILFREKLQDLKVEHIFEESLTRVNKNFSAFLSREKISEKEIQNINTTAGLISEDAIHFANSGKNKILLIHKSYKNNNVKTGARNSNDKEEYKISEISKQSEKDKEQYKRLKLFSNVLSGKIPESGSFLICNEALPEYISNNQLLNILSKLPPSGALEQIKLALEKAGSRISFSAIAIKKSSKKEGYSENKNKQSAHESIYILNKTEDKTSSLLSPSGIINLRKKIKIPFFSVAKKTKDKKSQNAKITIHKKASYILRIKNSFRNFLRISIGILANIFLFFKKKQKNTLKLKMKNLSLKRKVLLIIFGAVFFLLAFNIISTKVKEKRLREEAEYAELKSAIEQRQNKVEANLLYSNEEGAKNLYSEIEELIKDYPRETEEQKQEFDKYKEQLMANLEKIQKISRFDNLPELINFKNLNQEANPENIILSSSNKNIYVADSTMKAIYSFDALNNSATIAGNIGDDFGNLNSPAKTDNGIIYYFDNSSVISFNTNNNSSEMINITLSGDYNKAKSMIEVYSNRLYILNPQEKNIHRHNRLVSGFGPAYSWAAASADLENSVDLAIDGYVYVLKNTGKVIRFLRGEETDWRLQIIDPELSNPDFIVTSADMNFIYIMEKEKNRIAVFDKEGSFIAQYTSNTFKNMKDFTVDEESGKIYILNDSSIYKIEAGHLEE